MRRQMSQYGVSQGLVQEMHKITWTWSSFFSRWEAEIVLSVLHHLIFLSFLGRRQPLNVPLSASDLQQCKSRKVEGETQSVIWANCHRQFSHYSGAEGVGSKNQPWWEVSDPLPVVTWEWQDYAILQANLSSSQPTQRPAPQRLKCGSHWAFTRHLFSVVLGRTKNHLD
jgi:hypothetical protein